MKYSTNKDFHKLIQDVIHSEKGWFFKKGKTHGKLYSPSGEMIVVPNSPSDSRALPNFKQQISKAK